MLKFCGHLYHFLFINDSMLYPKRQWMFKVLQFFITNPLFWNWHVQPSIALEQWFHLPSSFRCNMSQKKCIRIVGVLSSSIDNILSSLSVSEHGTCTVAVYVACSGVVSRCHLLSVWRFQCAGMWYSWDWHIDTSISDEFAAFIIRVIQEPTALPWKQATSTSKVLELVYRHASVYEVISYTVLGIWIFFFIILVCSSFVMNVYFLCLRWLTT